LKIARWSDGLVLDRVPALQYHSTISRENQMSWKNAQSLALAGYSATEILASAYPTAEVRFGSDVQVLACQPNKDSENWIKVQSKTWREKLISRPGFEAPSDLKVCVSPMARGSNRGSVFSNFKTGELFVPKANGRNDEVSIVHEYLHLGFRNHPDGRNEKFIENLSREILGGR